MVSVHNSTMSEEVGSKISSSPYNSKCLELGSTVITLTQLLSQQSNCCRSRKGIRWHIPVNAIFAILYLFFIPVLSRPLFTFRTPNKDQKTEQLFYFLFIHVIQPRDIHELRGDCLCVCHLQALTKSASCKKWYVLVPLDRFP